MGLFDMFTRRKQQSEIDDLQQKMHMLAFPRGQAQINEEAGQLHALLRGRVSKSEAERLLIRNKKLLVIASDKSEARIVPSIHNSADGQLTEHESRLVYQFLTGVIGDLYSGSDGSSRENAVVINATSSIAGIDAEYKWLEARFGERDRDWKVQTRFHGQSKTNGHAYETFVIQISNGEEHTIHFDISSFYART